MNTAELTANNTGMDLIRRMVFARQRKDRAESELNGARCDVSNAESELVKWLVPKDAKYGDVFLVPVVEAFLEVRVEQSNAVEHPSGERSKEKTFSVGWRGNKPPKDQIR